MRARWGSMRYALICAGVMLAVVILWPFAFARTATVSARPDLPATVSMAIPPARPAVIRVSTPHHRSTAGGETACFRRYQATYDACFGPDAKACRLFAIDRWDQCETTGRWPN